MKSPSSAPERLLVIGQAGSGKTECAVQIARQLRQSDPDARVYWINCGTVGTVEKVNERYDDWQANIVHDNPRGWADLTAISTLYAQMAKPGDWVVVDEADKPWEWVRDLYVEQRERKAGNVVDFTVDPFAVVNTDITGPEYNTSINPAYSRWINPLLNSLEANLLLLTPAQAIKVAVDGKGWGDDKQIIEEFSIHGVRPAGQKHLIFQVHSCLLAKHKGGKDYTITSMKDRSRQLLQDAVVPNEGFPLVYLAGVGGWSL